jgi:hypothetical protein
VVDDGPILGGQERSFDKPAVLRMAGMDILIVSIPNQMLDLQQFRAFGIDLADSTVVALKSMQHFRAAFGPIAGRIVVCDRGALCTVQYGRLPYRRVPRPMFPLDPAMSLQLGHRPVPRRQVDRSGAATLRTIAHTAPSTYRWATWDIPVKQTLRPSRVCAVASKRPQSTAV